MHVLRVNLDSNVLRAISSKVCQQANMQVSLIELKQCFVFFYSQNDIHIYQDIRLFVSIHHCRWSTLC